ncbi:hypothetical protein HJC23_012137 [Cyclotella cryptica]|uniref:Uncharacterized protein n=1 Tax=Cyclotella cryptica TaxID=29204 RepID=A0ABD3PK13_9STRA
MYNIIIVPRLSPIVCKILRVESWSHPSFTRFTREVVGYGSIDGGNTLSQRTMPLRRITAIAWTVSPVNKNIFVCRTSRNNNNDEDVNNPRDNLGRALRGFQSSAFKEEIEVGDTVVCKFPIPNLGIYENTSYELRSVYAQSFDEETQSIVKMQLNGLNDPIPPGSALYVILFSPNHHTDAVVVSPEEVGLSSVRSELGDAAWLAVPGFFWVFVASNFYNIYHERTGGTFMDAFWGR